MNKDLTGCWLVSDGPPDDEGRERFTLYWASLDGPYRPELSLHDGRPVGHRRAQCFRADPAPYLKRGAVRVASEAEAIAAAWAGL